MLTHSRVFLSLVIVSAACSVCCSRPDHQLRTELSELSRSSGLVVGHFPSHDAGPDGQVLTAMVFGPLGNLLFEKRIMAGHRVGFIRSSPRADRFIWGESRNRSRSVVITDIDGQIIWEHPM